MMVMEVEDVETGTVSSLCPLLVHHTMESEAECRGVGLCSSVATNAVTGLTLGVYLPPGTPEEPLLQYNQERDLWTKFLMHEHRGLTFNSQK